MKFGPVTKQTLQEKQFNDDVMPRNCDVIFTYLFMANLILPIPSTSKRTPKKPTQHSD